MQRRSNIPSNTPQSGNLRDLLIRKGAWNKHQGLQIYLDQFGSASMPPKTWHRKKPLHYMQMGYVLSLCVCCNICKEYLYARKKIRTICNVAQTKCCWPSRSMVKDEPLVVGLNAAAAEFTVETDGRNAGRAGRDCCWPSRSMVKDTRQSGSSPVEFTTIYICVRNYMVTYLYNWKTTITTGSSAFLIQDHLRRLVAGVAAPRAPR